MAAVSAGAIFTYNVRIPVSFTIQKRIVSGARNWRFQTPVHRVHARELTAPCSRSGLVSCEGKIHCTAQDGPADDEQQGG